MQILEAAVALPMALREHAPAACHAGFCPSMGQTSRAFLHILDPFIILQEGAVHWSHCELDDRAQVQ